jgi:hypothetical protein
MAETGEDRGLDIIDDSEEVTSRPRRRKMGKRIGMMLFGLVTVGAVGAGAYVAWPYLFPYKEVPAEDVAFTGENLVNCTQLVEDYEPRNAEERRVYEGGEVTFEGTSFVQAHKTYREHREALVARACELYISQNPDVLNGRLFDIEVANEPVHGQESTFQVMVAVRETEFVATPD